MTSSSTHQRIPILVYHHVYPEGSSELEAASGNQAAGVIGKDEFTRQMGYIADEGWTVVPTSHVVDWLLGEGSLPPQAVALHFDNGWLDTYTVTAPLLKAMNFTATCFPITDGVEKESTGGAAEVRTLTEGNVTKPFMTWQHAREMLDEGWEIGAHTHTHPRMGDHHDTEGDEGVLREVDQSSELFKERLGCQPQHFAYPSGSRNERTDELLSDRYRSLRLWHFEQPIVWSFTDQNTSRLAIDCQNIDARVSFEAFQRLFRDAGFGG